MFRIFVCCQRFIARKVSQLFGFNPGIGTFYAAHGMVQDWVARNVTPLKCRYNKSDWWVMSQKQHKCTNYLTNTITMVVEPQRLPAAWIWWFHATRGAGGLAHTFSKAAIEGFCLIHQINVGTNLFMLTSMFYWNRAGLPATMMANMAPIVTEGNP